MDQAVEEAKRCQELGIPGVILSACRRSLGCGRQRGLERNGLVQQATRAIKRACPELVVIIDACFDGTTTHGHCGVVMPERGWPDVDNDATLENLGRVVVSQAKAGPTWSRRRG